MKFFHLRITIRLLVSPVVLILYFSQWGCVRKIDPKKADEEVRKLLEDVPGFDWEPSQQSRLVFPERDTLLVPPVDDNISREITLRIQKDDAYEDGNESSILENRPVAMQHPQ